MLWKRLLKPTDGKEWRRIYKVCYFLRLPLDTLDGERIACPPTSSEVRIPRGFFNSARGVVTEQLTVAST